MSVVITNALPNEYPEIGQLMVAVYSNLEGFPSRKEQPAYYEMLANIGEFAARESVELIIARDGEKLLGAVVYINDMKDYGAGGTATQEKNAAGFRLLAVSNDARGMGIGKKLTIECIERAQKNGLKQMIIHTTESMKVAWGMYEKIGFKRSEDLDFEQNGLSVFGFRLKL